MKGREYALIDAVKVAFEIGDQVAEAQGCFLIDVEYLKEGNSNFLRLYIDKEGGVGIDECEKFSDAFGVIFDKADPIKEEYFLEVSSPGVDRILKTQREFDYFSGREVAVKMYAPLNGKKEFDGVLKEMKDKVVTVIVQDEEIKFNIKEAVYVRLLFNI